MNTQHDSFDYHGIDARSLSEAQVTARDEALSTNTWCNFEQDNGDIDAEISNLLQHGWTYDGQRHKRLLFKRSKPLPRSRLAWIPWLR